ncbi:MAG: UvrD-helicase domain-containing protein, partial [Lachnospiraceae bacterium]|nr:UvrD-helicase domain-containing protein [Lachnospiraceae bacterium]
MAPQFTTDQQKVIDHREGGLLVSAAAGSGKTTVMVEQIVSMLKDRSSGLTMDKLLVVTFTNAAASSMKAKLPGRKASGRRFVNWVR